MEDILNKLNNEEYKIITSVKSLIGANEKKIEECIRLNIFEDYKKIHIQYSKLNNIEGLKRAIFIQWYAVVEPNVYTGIDSLNKEVEKQNLEKVNDLMFNHLLDREFKIMLSYYYNVCDWYFKNIEKFIHKIDKDQKLNLDKINIMIDRGQMGEYWNSLRSDNADM